MTIFILSVTGALTISALCSLLEATLLSYSPSQVAALQNRRPRLGAIWDGFKQNIEKPIAVILVTNTAAHTVGATVAGAQFEKIFGEQGLVLFSIVFTYFMLQFTEILPKSLGVRYNEALAIVIAAPLQLTVRVMAPLLWFIHFVNRPFMAGGEKEVDTLDQIAALAAQARVSRAIDPGHARMIQSASTLEDISVRQIMTPRTQVTYLRTVDPIERVLDVMKRSPYTRLPLCHNDLDDIEGMVHLKDVVKILNLVPRRLDADKHPGAPPEERRAPVDSDLHVIGAGRIDLTSIRRDVLFLPEHLDVLRALREFQQARLHFAAVIDEYGSTVGIVTLEDVLEEVVGDIRDEFDLSSPDLIQRVETGYRVNALFPLHEITHHIPDIGIDHAEETVDTVGGYLTQTLERLPERGEIAIIGQYRWTVTAADARRVRELLIEPLQTE